MRIREFLGQDSTSSTWPRTLGLIRIVFVWSVWVCATVGVFLYVRHYARNMPIYEDFEFVPVMTGQQPISLSWITAQSNEHRLVIPKLMMAGLLRALPDFRSGLYLNAAWMSAATASMILLAHRVRGSTRCADAVLPLLMLNIGQCECFLICFALNLVMTAWAACAFLAVANGSKASPGWWTCLAAGGLLVFLPLCGGSGMALLPPLLLWLAGYVAFGWWSGHDPGPAGRAIGVGLLMITAGVVTWYLLGYVRPPHIPTAPSPAAARATTLEALSLAISPNSWGYWRAAGIAVLALSALTMLRLGLVALRSPGERPAAMGYAAVIAGLLIVAGSVGYSRSGLGPGAGLASRYITLLAALTGTIYLAWLAHGSERGRRLVHAFLFVIVVAGIPAQLRTAHSIGAVRRNFYASIERGIRAGEPMSRILDVACPRLHPSRTTISDSFQMLKRAGVGQFAYLADEGIARALSEAKVIR